MTQEIKQVWSSGVYQVVVSPAVEGISPEPHYAVVCTAFNVVEYRTTSLERAISFCSVAEEVFEDAFASTEEEYNQSDIIPMDVANDEETPIH